jgi:hypothetical protein
MSIKLSGVVDTAGVALVVSLTLLSQRSVVLTTELLKTQLSQFLKKLLTLTRVVLKKDIVVWLEVVNDFPGGQNK